MLLDDFMFLMSLFVCLIVICGSINFDFGLVIRCSNICVCVIVFGVNLFLIFVILSMKCLHAIFDIFLNDVMTLLLCIIFLGGAFVQVFISSLTVVQSLLILLTYGLR